MRIVYSARFRRELAQLEGYIAERASAEAALRYTDRMIDKIEALEAFPERHGLRPELGADLRVLMFGGRYQVAYRVKNECVSVVALFGPGQRLTLIQDPT